MNHMSACDQKGTLITLIFKQLINVFFLRSKDAIIHFWHVATKDGKT